MDVDSRTRNKRRNILSKVVLPDEKSTAAIYRAIEILEFMVQKGVNINATNVPFSYYANF